MSCKALLVVIIGVAAMGCRADVDGMWEGTVGEDVATLSIDQAGEALRGDICIGELCADVRHGGVVEREVSFQYGCAGCDLPTSEMVLALSGDELTGDAYVQLECPCGDHGCECRPAVSLVRCSGGCE